MPEVVGSNPIESRNYYSAILINKIKFIIDNYFYFLYHINSACNKIKSFLKICLIYLIVNKFFKILRGA